MGDARDNEDETGSFVGRTRTTEIFIKSAAETIHIGNADEEASSDGLPTVEIELSELLQVQVEMRKFFHFLRKPNQFFKNHPPADFIPQDQLRRLANVYDHHIKRWLARAEQPAE